CTPKEAAQILRLCKKDGSPNPKAVKNLCARGELEFIPVTNRNILIARSAINDFIKRKTCPVKAPAPKLNLEKTVENGECLNLSKGTDIGMLAAFQAGERLKTRLQKSSSKDGGAVRQIRRSER